MPALAWIFVACGCLCVRAEVCFPVNPAEEPLPRGLSDGSELRIAAGNWASSRLVANLAKILITEKQAFKSVRIVDTGGSHGFQAIADGEVDVVLEVWSDRQLSTYTKYVRTEQSVEDAGLLGYVGQSGWYVHQGSFDRHQMGGFLISPSEWLNDGALLDSFARSVVVGDGNWSTTVATRNIIAGLNHLWPGAALEMRSAEGGELVSGIPTDIASGRVSVTNLWKPHPYIRLYNLSRVTLPVETQRCLDDETDTVRDCDFSALPLLKIVSPRLKDSHPAVYEFVKRFTLSEFQMNELLELAFTDVDTSISTELQSWRSACTFLKQGDGTWWGKWLPLKAKSIFIQRLQVTRHSAIDRPNVVLPGDEITVFGLNFPQAASADLLLCRVGGQISEAVYNSQTEIVCFMPETVANSIGEKVSVHISADAGQTWSDGFAMDAEITWGQAGTAPSSTNPAALAGNNLAVVRIGMLIRGHRPQVLAQSVAFPDSLTFGQLQAGTADSNHAGTDGHLELAVALAVEEINNSTAVLPFTRLELLLQYTGEDDASGGTVTSNAVRVSDIMAGAGSEHAFQDHAEKGGMGLGQAVIYGRKSSTKKEEDVPLLIGIVGAQWSTTSIEVSNRVASVKNILLLSYQSTSPLLSSAQQHPYFLRLCGSDSVQGPLLANTLAHFKWSRALVVIDSTEYSSGLQKSLFASGQDLGITFEVAPHIYSGDSVAQCVSHLKASPVSIYVILVHSEHIQELLSAAVTEGLMSKDDVWFGTDSFDNVFFRLSFVKTIAGSVFYTTPQLTNKEHAHNALLDRWRQRFGKHSRLPETVSPVLAYDAINMISVAAHDLISKTSTSFDTISSSAGATTSSGIVQCSVTVTGLPCAGGCNSSGVCAVRNNTANGTDYGDCVNVSSEDKSNCPIPLLVRPVYRGCRVWENQLWSGLFSFSIGYSLILGILALRNRIGMSLKTQRIGFVLATFILAIVSTVVLVPNVFVNNFCNSDNRGGVPSCLPYPNQSSLVPAFFPISDIEIRAAELRLGPNNTVAVDRPGSFKELYRVKWTDISAPLTSISEGDLLDIEDVRQNNAGVTIIHLKGSLQFEVPTSQGFACSALQWPSIVPTNPNSTCQITVQGQSCVAPFARFGVKMPAGSCENSTGTPLCPTSFSPNFRGGTFFGWRECVVVKSGEECPDAKTVKRQWILKKLRNYQGHTPFVGVAQDYTFVGNDPSDAAFTFLALRVVQNSLQKYSFAVGTASAFTFNSSSASNVFKTAATPAGYSSSPILPKAVRLLLVTNKQATDPATGKKLIETGADLFLNGGTFNSSGMLPFTKVITSEVLHPEDDFDTIKSLVESDVIPVGAMLVNIKSSQAIKLSQALPQLPMFAITSSSPTLSQVQRFPFFARVVASDLYQASTVAELAHHFRWNSICPLYRMDEDYSKQLSQAFIAAAARLGISINELCPIGMMHDETSIKSAVVLMKASKSIVFMAAVYMEDVPMLWTEAEKAGLLQDHVIWLGTDTWGESVFQSSNYPKTTTFLSTSFTSFTTTFWEDRFRPTMKVSPFARRSGVASTIALTHDACQLAVISLDRAFRDFATRTASCDVHCLRQHIAKYRSTAVFVGATGLVQLEGNDRVNPTYSVLDAANVSLRVVGSSSPGIEIAVSQCLLGLPPCCPALSSPLNASFCACIEPGDDAETPRGAFRSNRGDSSSPCHPCPVGAMCLDSQLYPIQGWWRSSETATFSLSEAKLSHSRVNQPIFNESSIHTSVMVVLPSNPKTLAGQVQVGDIGVPIRWIVPPEVNPDAALQQVLVIAAVYPRVGGVVLLEDNSSFANPQNHNVLWFAQEAKLTMCPERDNCLGWPLHREDAGCSTSTHGRLCSRCNQEKALSGAYYQLNKNGVCSDCEFAWLWLVMGLMSLHITVILYYKMMVFGFELPKDFDRGTEDGHIIATKTRAKLLNGGSLKLLCAYVQLIAIIFKIVNVEMGDVSPAAFVLMQSLSPDFATHTSRCVAAQLDFEYTAYSEWIITLSVVLYVSLLPLAEWLCCGRRTKHEPTVEQLEQQLSDDLTSRELISKNREQERRKTEEEEEEEEEEERGREGGRERGWGSFASKVYTKGSSFFTGQGDTTETFDDLHPLFSLVFIVRHRGQACVFLEDLIEAVQSQACSSAQEPLNAIFDSFPRTSQQRVIDDDIEANDSNSPVQLTRRLAVMYQKGDKLVRLSAIDGSLFISLKAQEPTTYEAVAKKLQERRWIRQQALFAFRNLVFSHVDKQKTPFVFDNDMSEAADIGIPNERLHHFLQWYCSSRRRRLEEPDLMLLQEHVCHFSKNTNSTNFLSFCEVLKRIATPVQSESSSTKCWNFVASVDSTSRIKRGGRLTWSLEEGGEASGIVVDDAEMKEGSNFVRVLTDEKQPSAGCDLSYKTNDGDSHKSDLTLVFSASYLTLDDQITAVMRTAHAYRKVKYKDSVMHGINVVLMMMHPTLLRTCLSMLICQEIEGFQYIRHDPSQECQGAVYNTYAVLSVVILILYCVGIPAYMVLSIFRKVSGSLTKRVLPASAVTYRLNDRAMHRFGFLFRYYPKYGASDLLVKGRGGGIEKRFTWWWDLWLASRNSILIVLIGFLPLSNEKNNVVYALISSVLALSVILSVHTKPFGSGDQLSKSLNALDAASVLCTLLFVLFSPYAGGVESWWSTEIPVFTGALSAMFIFAFILFTVGSRLYFRKKLRKLASDKQRRLAEKAAQELMQSSPMAPQPSGDAVTVRNFPAPTSLWSRLRENLTSPEVLVSDRRVSINRLDDGEAGLHDLPTLTAPDPGQEEEGLQADSSHSTNPETEDSQQTDPVPAVSRWSRLSSREFPVMNDPDEADEGELSHHRIERNTRSGGIAMSTVDSWKLRDRLKTDAMPSREGWLMKQSQSWGNWNQRWFRLRGGTLSYWHKEQPFDAKPEKGRSFDLREAVVTDSGENGPSKARFAFRVDCGPNVSWMCACDTASDQAGWLQDLQGKEFTDAEQGASSKTGINIEMV